ncbi:high-affinity nicotinic acid transporter [Trichomonascus vanleenenianus]|uniref:high-affinity nicotinic acid transporter n=1 Tax=Trichomonascus vanleenenianus TaxID=2268995 RepID=UPI003ECAC1AD
MSEKGDEIYRVENNEVGVVMDAEGHVQEVKVDDARIHDPKAERRLCRKLDIHILPFIAFMYLFNALDKGNISNAKTDGIEADLHMKPDDWNLLISIFYIPFVLCAFPITFVIKKFTAARVIPLLMIGFGSLSLICAAVVNFGGLMVVRFMLGICESAFFPGIIFYLSTFYRRAELARRLAIFYAAANIANAFSGLLAFGLFQVNGRLHGWQYLFLVEGSMTIVTAIIGFIYLPRTPATARFFNEEEKALAFHRIQTDSTAVVGENVSIRDAIKVFAHPVTIGWLIISICVGVPLNSINNWLPQVIQALGQGTVKTNLLTVAPNIWGAVCLLILAFSSDLSQVRFPYIMAAFAIECVGFLVYGVIDINTHYGAAYFATFLMCSGGSASSVILATWYNNNTPGETRRAVLSAVGIPLANAAGLISSNIFLPKDAPKYVPALGITAGFAGLGILLTGAVALYMVVDNKRRNKQQGVSWTYKDISTEIMGEGPKHPSFRWML